MDIWQNLRTSPCGCSEEKLCRLGEGEADLTRQIKRAFCLYVVGNTLCIYIPAGGENREEQGGALNSKIAVIAMLQFEALEDGESQVKSDNTGNFLGNAKYYKILWNKHTFLFKIKLFSQAVGQILLFVCLEQTRGRFGRAETCTNSEFLPIVFFSLLQLLLSTVSAKMMVVFKDSQSLKKKPQQCIKIDDIYGLVWNDSL